MSTDPINDEEITLDASDKMDSPSLTNTEINSTSSDGSYHLLEGRWTFWYTHRPTTFRNSAVNYDSCLKKLGLFF